MGLIGYINDEMQRRSKEIAIRKVMGQRRLLFCFCFRKIYFGLQCLRCVSEHWGPGIWELCGRTSFLKRLNFRYTIIS